MSCGSVTVDGAELAYVREGRGPPLFIVGSATYYPKAFSRRLRDDFDLIFADSRHFVPSYVPDPEPAAPLTLDRIAEDVDVVREQLGVDRWPRSGTRSTRRSRWPSRVATQTGSLIWSSLAGCHIPLPSLRTRPHALWRRKHPPNGRPFWQRRRGAQRPSRRRVTHAELCDFLPCAHTVVLG